jgi:hypothetical protein
MARRAVGALAAVLALGAVILPAAMITGAAAPAAAATGQQSATTELAAPAEIAITGISPQWATPSSTITVTGTLTNTSPHVYSHLIVQLLGSSRPVSSVAQLQQSAAGRYLLADVALPNASFETPGALQPGASVNWSIQLPASAMGMTRFGVYPLAAHAEDVLGDPLATSPSYLPYTPAANGPYAATMPAAQKIAWVWPLMDQPLLDEPWQSACSGPQAATLAQSLGAGGRLGQLLDAAATTAGGAVQARAAVSVTGTPLSGQAARAAPVQSLASYDGVTWAVDPALLANVAALEGCGREQPQWAQAASAWLARLKAATAGQPVFSTPYGDPDVTSIISAGYATDVQRSFSYGQLRAGQILGRDLGTSAAGGSAPAGQADATGVAWSAGEPATYSTLENLAAVDGVHSILLGSSAFPFEQMTVLRTLDGAGSYMNVLLASDSLTSLVGSAGSTTAAFTTAQEFLAETALMVQANPSVPIIVAPPQRWLPPTGLPAQLLSETGSVPWLSPASLTSLTGAAAAPTVQAATSTSAPAMTSLELSKLGTLDQEISQLQALREQPDPSLYLGVSTVESSAYTGQFSDAAAGMLSTLDSRLAQQQHGVRIVAESRITLGGLRGTIPVSIDNRLGYPVEVEIKLSYSQATGTKITAVPSGVVRVPARTAQTIRLRVAATQTGSTAIAMALATKTGQELTGQPVRMTVQTTQFGLLGMIIGAIALGVFLIASAARAIRRGRPGPAGDSASDGEPSGGDQPGQSTEEAVSDSTGAEHSELGTAGTSRPR